MADQYWSNTELLLRCDGTDASTTFTDSSSNGHTVTANGNAQIDTAQSKYGGASALFDGTGDYLSVPAHSSFNFGSNDFTIECWVRFDVLPGTDGYMAFVSAVDVGGPTFDFEFGVYETSSDFYLWFQWTEGGVADNVTLSTDTWYHAAVVRNGSQIQLFWNGTALGTTAITDDVDVTTNLRIGGVDAPTGYEDYFNGWIDDLRISNGVARYWANFTPAQLPDNTAALVGATSTEAHVSADADFTVYLGDTESTQTNSSGTGEIVISNLSVSPSTQKNQSGTGFITHQDDHPADHCRR